MLLLAARADVVFEVATVDHQLRPGSADDCALVAKLCEKLDVSCRILTVNVSPGNLQQEARRARYRALGNWAQEVGTHLIATAHHADDQAETMLMRLNRGSGLSGLAGIRQRTEIEECGVPIIRPLLSFRRHELRSVVTDAGVTVAEDPSNTNDQFDRVRIRKALQQADWLDPAAIAQSAAHLASADASFDGVVIELWNQQASVTDDIVTVPHTGRIELDGRMLQRAIARLGGEVPFGDAAKLLNRLGHLRGKGNLGGVLVERFDEITICRREPPRKTG